MELQQFDLLVVLPVGPGTNLDFVLDTLDSIYFYCQCSLRIIIVDDSLQGLGELIKQKSPDVELLVNRRSNGLGAGLYLTLSEAYRYILSNYTFKALFKVDTDALIIGFDPQIAAFDLFESDPAIGYAGLFKSGNEIVDFSGRTFDNRWPRNYMFDVTCTWKVIKRPLANFTLRKYVRKAFGNGFNLGDNIFGGAYFMSESLLRELERNDLLPDRALGHSRMEEDHLFSVLTSAIGFRMADLAAGEGPFAMNWKMLPASPQTLLRFKKKVIHSTRSWQEMDEHAIRAFFRDLRTSAEV
jgi:hypothetical protein